MKGRRRSKISENREKSEHVLSSEVRTLVWLDLPYCTFTDFNVKLLSNLIPDCRTWLEVADFDNEDEEQALMLGRPGAGHDSNRGCDSDRRLKLDAVLFKFCLRWWENGRKELRLEKSKSQRLGVKGRRQYSLHNEAPPALARLWTVCTHSVQSRL